MSLRIKKTISLLLAVLTAMLCFSCTAAAADAKAVLSFKVSDDGYAFVSDCDSKAAGVISVPTKITLNNKDYPVKYIGDRAFDKCRLITKISIPEGVTAIGSNAFRECDKLEEVIIPETLVRCEYDAFNGCSDVTVYCFMSNYPFVELCGTYSNITIEIIDKPETPEEPEKEEDEWAFLEEFGFVGTFIKALRGLIDDIMNYFGANDDEIEFDYTELLPFDIPKDNPLYEEIFGKK